jgi:hypothetical protein
MLGPLWQIRLLSGCRSIPLLAYTCTTHLKKYACLINNNPSSTNPTTATHLTTAAPQTRAAPAPQQQHTSQQQHQKLEQHRPYNSGTTSTPHDSTYYYRSTTIAPRSSTTIIAICGSSTNSTAHPVTTAPLDSSRHQQGEAEG